MLQLLDVGSLMTCPDLVLLGRGQLLLRLLQITGLGNYDAAISVQAGYNRNRNARKAVKKKKKKKENGIWNLDWNI